MGSCFGDRYLASEWHNITDSGQCSWLNFLMLGVLSCWCSFIWVLIFLYWADGYCTVVLRRLIVFSFCACICILMWCMYCFAAKQIGAHLMQQHGFIDKYLYPLCCVLVSPQISPSLCDLLVYSLTGLYMTGDKFYNRTNIHYVACDGFCLKPTKH